MLIVLRILQFTMLYIGCAYLCYMPFQDKIRYSRRRISTVLFLLGSVMLTIYFVLYRWVSVQAAYLFFLAIIPIMGMAYLRSVKETIYKSLLVLLLVDCYAAFVCGWAAWLADWLPLGIDTEILYTIAIVGIGALTYRPVYRFVSVKIMPLMNQVSVNDLQSIYWMPLFYMVLQATFFTLYNVTEQMNHLVYFIVLLALNISIYSLGYDIVRILNGTVDKLCMLEKLSTADQMLELQKNQYASWVAQIEEVRRAKHDLKYHIAMVQQFLDNDDKAGLQEYVRSFQRVLPTNIPIILCKNVSVNAILLYYYELARREKIKLELIADVDPDIAIDPRDLSVVFGNCLENAFEACARMEPEAEKTISLMAKPVGSGLAIIIDNTFDGQVHKENDVYLSDKREHSVGIGIESVKIIAKKYGGTVSFETKENIFMTSIRLGSAVQGKK
ncbi:MAG: GHKL domain-containing protein [Clostridium sp.]